MQLIMIGCEYVGKTTLGEGIMNWLRDTVGADTGWHDHFTLPTLERGKNLMDVEKAKTILGLLETCPRLVEQYQRFQHEQNHYEHYPAYRHGMEPPESQISVSIPAVGVIQQVIPRKSCQQSRNSSLPRES